jgi:hypothetical protein
MQRPGCPISKKKGRKMDTGISMVHDFLNEDLTGWSESLLKQALFDLDVSYVLMIHAGGEGMIGMTRICNLNSHMFTHTMLDSSLGRKEVWEGDKQGRGIESLFFRDPF